MTKALDPAVLIMAGGTGGHVFPALATAECLRQRGIRVEWLGTERGIESRLVPQAKIVIHYIQVAGLRGKGMRNTLLAPWQLLRALWQSWRVLRQVKPICVLGMGGFASGPGGVAAFLTRRPLLIHEQNAVAGTTNRLLSRLAKRVLQGYPIGLGGSKGFFVGNPIRKSITDIPAPQARGVAQNQPLRLLVLGGSLGAKPINDVLPQALVKMTPSLRPKVWHQCGEQHADAVVAEYRYFKVEARVDAFISDMAAAYSWADLVMCRAGALTVAEVAAVGLAAILVPLPHAIDDHQTQNAHWLVGQGGAVLMLQDRMSAETLAQLLDKLLSDKPALLKMAELSRSAARTDAADRVADSCLEVAHG